MGLALDPVTVTATLLPTPVREVGSSVSVVTSADIGQKQERTLPEVLQDLPGLNVVQTGSPGGVTSVYIRGANANHTKVYIDGIDATDPSAPDGAFDFSQILASDIERVEVLRGPQSGLYGSDAIGGVVNIITKTGSGPPRLRGTIEGGSFSTFNQTAGVSGSISRLTYDLDFAHFHSGDTEVTPVGLVPPGRSRNPDYYDNKTVSSKLGLALSDNLDVGAVVRYVDTDLVSTSDDFLGPEPARSYSNNHELFTRGFAHFVLFDGTFDQTVGINYTEYQRPVFDPNPADVAAGNDPAHYNGSRAKLDWQGHLKLAAGETVVLGAEHELDRLDDSAPVSAHVTNDAGYAELQSNIGERFFNALSVRFDDNGEFGGYPTFREAPAFVLPTGTKLKGSVGTGFKAPPLDQLYDSYPQYNFFANPNLKPETSLGFDMGLEQSLWDKTVEFGGTYFHNNIDNLIDINETGTTYQNIGRATTYGGETFATYRPWEPLALRADYTYTMATDDITNSELLRRPKHKASLNARWQATDKLLLSATVLYTGSWVDVSRSGLESGLRAPPYTLLNLAGSYDLGHGLTAFARINNLLDRHYQDPIGFQHQGLGVLGGLRVAFDAPLGAAEPRP
ncbi:MAG: TonB-dependent receptor [Alphaproteobacteria bacterium]|nr:TonB-dependent receptor [Alphaproteobacteria bacterium]